jgi:hypothetical protein
LALFKSAPLIEGEDAAAFDQLEALENFLGDYARFPQTNARAVSV